MKKEPFIIAALFAAMAFSPAFAGMFSANPLIKPDHAYELDTWGSNSEVYEFRPQSDPSRICVVYILDNLKSMDMECFPAAPVGSGPAVPLSK